MIESWWFSSDGLGVGGPTGDGSGSSGLENDDPGSYNLGNDDSEIDALMVDVPWFSVCMDDLGNQTETREGISFVDHSNSQFMFLHEVVVEVLNSSLLGEQCAMYMSCQSRARVCSGDLDRRLRLVPPIILAV